jgi:hypothetical protein
MRIPALALVTLAGFAAPAALAALAALAGCAAPMAEAPPAPLERSFSCEGPSPLQPSRPSWGTLGVGRLEVKRLSGPQARAEFDAVHVRVIADGAPLASLGAQLADALGVGVVVEESLVGVRVGLALPDVDVRSLLRILAQSYRIYPGLHDGAIHLEPDVGALRGRSLDEPAPPPTDVGPAELRVLEVPEPVPPEHFAQSYCSLLASRWGHASVLGRSVLLRDFHERLEAAAALLRASTARRGQ